MSSVAICHSGAGNGHTVRCRALADELRHRGVTTFLHMMPPATEIIAWAEVMVLDLGPEDHVIYAIPTKPAKYVRIVDTVVDTSNADLIICGSAGAEARMFQGKGSARVLAGPDYCLLRPQFAAERRITHRRDGIVDLRRAGDQWDARIVASQVARATVAITYGGMRAMEATCVGTPTVIYPRNEGEHLNARGLMMAGAALVADESELQVMAAELMKVAPLAAKMSASARQLIDGRGVDRVAHAIMELLAA